MQEEKLYLPKALHHLKLGRRTFDKKRPIAELQILDSAEFDRLVEVISQTSRGRKISREKQAAECRRFPGAFTLGGGYGSRGMHLGGVYGAFRDAFRVRLGCV